MRSKVKCKCLEPHCAWLCGKKVCKDGIVSDNLVFDEGAAISYFVAIGKPSWIKKKMVHVPCGKCVLCLKRKRRDMSTRLSLEAKMWSESTFLTLTYDDDHIPLTDLRPMGHPDKMIEFGDCAADQMPLPVQTLFPRDVQLFIKRLRRHLDYHFGKRIRYFCVGEYGTKTGRPHYHLIIFGWRPTDTSVQSVRGNIINYTSSLIGDLWKYGFHLCSDVTPAVSRYCAQYVTKKLVNYSKPDSAYRVPEFTTQSTRNGGMGAPWFDVYGENALDKGFVTVDGAKGPCKCSIPKSFISRCRKYKVPLFLRVREKRRAYAESNPVVYKLSELLNSAKVFRHDMRAEINKELL